MGCKFQKIKKDQFYIICLQLVLTCVILVLFFGVNIYENLYAEKLESSEYKYTYETTMTTKENMLDEEVSSVFENLQCNVKIINFDAYIDATGETVLMDIIVNSVYENMPFAEGSFDNFCNGAQVCVIGVTYKNYVYEIDGIEYFDIFGEPYRVCGYLSSGKGMSFDYKIVLPLVGLGDDFKDKLVEETYMGELELIFESYTNDTDVIFDDVAQKVSLIKEDTEIFLGGVAIYNNENVFCIIIYAFCLACVYMILVYYIKRHDKEMAIRRICGYSAIRNIGILYKNILCNFLVSLCVSSILIKIIMAIFAGYLVDLNMKFTLSNFANVVIVFLVSLIVVSIHSIIFLIKMDPITYLRKR